MVVWSHALRRVCAAPALRGAVPPPALRSAAPPPPLRSAVRASKALPAGAPHVMVGGGRVNLPVAVRNIYCIGRNYAEHARELGNEVPTTDPIIFLKASSSVRGLDPAEEIAFADESFHHEAELVLLIGEHVPLGALAEGSEYKCLRAVGLGLDLTRRGVQSELKKAGKPWTLAKSFGGSAVVAPMSSVDGSFSLDEIGFELEVNETTRQRGHVNQMIFSMPFQLRYLNRIGALLPGDLIFTGTPAGVGELRRADRFALRFTEPEALAGAWQRGVL